MECKPRKRVTKGLENVNPNFVKVKKSVEMVEKILEVCHIEDDKKYKVNLT